MIKYLSQKKKNTYNKVLSPHDFSWKRNSLSSNIYLNIKNKIK